MPKQQREKIGTMECKSCESFIDVKRQKNGVAYAHCGHCGIRHTGGLHSPELLGGLEHHGAVHLEQTNITINGGTVNGSVSGDVETVNITNNNTKVEKGDDDVDDWDKW